MTDTKHTPGPWSADPEGEHYTSVQSDATGQVVADVRHEQFDETSGVPLGEGWENARLIAAAPDLLAALETIRTWLVAPDTSPDTLRAMHDLADLEISKARGQA